MGRYDKVLILGCGGSEHAIAAKLAESTNVFKIFVSPGNAGTHLCSKKVKNVDLKTDEEVVGFCVQNDIALVYVGSLNALAKGISDRLKHHGIYCFGPSLAAVDIETSKVWAKEFMTRNHIPTATWASFNSLSKSTEYVDEHFPIVIKVSGIAHGKGVFFPDNKDEAKHILRQIFEDKIFGDSNCVVLEEFVTGSEITVLGFSDGSNITCMPATQNYKHRHDGNKGLCTVGMGCVAPSSIVTDRQYQECCKILQNTIKALKAEDRPFVGVLCAGFMLNFAQGPIVIKFNSRFRDPEAQTLLPLLETNLHTIMHSCMHRVMNDIEWRAGVAVSVIGVHKVYPYSQTSGQAVIIPTSIRKTGDHNTSIYVTQCDTCIDTNSLPVSAPDTVGSVRIYASGGRVLGVTVVAPNVSLAQKTAYEGIKGVYFEGLDFRHDIGNEPLRLGILGSSSATILPALLQRMPHDMHASIAMVVSHKPCGLIEKAIQHHLPYLIVPRTPYVEDDITVAFQQESVDLILVIGYHHILSKSFTDTWYGRCINVHPSLLPAFPGRGNDVHRSVLEAKVEETGCTIHLVTDNVEGGDILCQKKCHVEKDDTVESLKRRVQNLEVQAFLDVINKYHTGVFPKPTLREIDNSARDELSQRLLPLCHNTNRKGSITALAPFAGYFDLKAAGIDTDSYVLASSCSGVGSKARLAQEVDQYDGIGTDLVAMNVNHLAAAGADPLFMMDYFSTGKLNKDAAMRTMESISKGCQDAGVALVGGETITDCMLMGIQWDLAGFCVGAIPRSHVMHSVVEGDILLGLASSGLHCAGFEFFRHCVDELGLDYGSAAPFDQSVTLGCAMLEPTRMYSKEMQSVLRKGLLHGTTFFLCNNLVCTGAAHITHGGIARNLGRILPDNLMGIIDLASIELPPLLQWLYADVGIKTTDMLHAFNCGIGMILVAAANDVDTIKTVLCEEHINTMLIGTVKARGKHCDAVEFNGGFAATKF